MGATEMIVRRLVCACALATSLIVSALRSEDVVSEDESVEALHQLLVKRQEARYQEQQASRTKRLAQHHLNQCNRAKAYAERDTRVADKFAAFAKQYQQHCLHFRYSCRQNRKYKSAVKRYRARAAGWHKRISTLKCKTKKKGF